MSFLDEVSAFGKGLSQKTKDMVDVTSNNSKIAGLEKQVNQAYSTLGAKYFADKVNDLEGPYQDELNVIRNLMSQINQIQGENKAIEEAQAQAAQAAAEAKAQAAQAAADAKAAKQAAIDAGAGAAKEADRQAFIAAGGKICPNCGNKVPAGNFFCTGCGTKME